MSYASTPGGGSGPILVDPYDVYAASKVFAAGQDRLTSITWTLGGVLDASGGMAGNDANGRRFGARYDPAAAALLNLLSTTVPLLGSMATCLVTTANNYIKAEHHSTAGASPLLPSYPLPGLTMAVTTAAPPSAVGPGSSGLPGPLAKYWPNAHQDQLRNAATALGKAATDLNNLGVDLSNAVRSVTDNNSSTAVTAMSEFFDLIWHGGDHARAPLSAAMDACAQLAGLCERYAAAVDSAHSAIENALAEASVAIGLTTVAGWLGTVFTLGGSDAAAAAADTAEAAAILGPIADEFTAAVSTELEAAYLDEIVSLLQSAAEDIPSLSAVEAETTPVGSALESEMQQAEERELANVGGRGGSGGGSGSGGTAIGGGDGAQAWDAGGDDPALVADKIAMHMDEQGHTVDGIDDADLPEYMEEIMRQPGYKIRSTPSGVPRMAWWDPDTGMVLIRTGNGGTFFEPDNGYDYLLELLSE